MKNNSSIAALIIAFRRHANLSTQIKRLGDSGITRVYIAVDAAPANDPQAIIDVARTLDVAKNMTMENLEVRVSTHESNVGCSAGVLSACDWFFSMEDFGVILEDDCIPTPDFFKYVDSAKSHLNDDANWLICGTQFAPPNLAASDWLLSKYPLIWGWATSRENWNVISAELKNGSSGDFHKDISKSEKQYWRAGARRSSAGLVDAWDNILVYRMLINSKHAILPKFTLVTNIGSDHVATHTPATSKWLGLETGSFTAPNTAPVANQSLDLWLRNNFYKISKRHLLTTRLTSMRDKFMRNPGSSLAQRWAEANQNLIEISVRN